MLRPVPQGGTTAAGAGTGAAAGEALVTGGAVVAAAGSVLLLCFTAKAVVAGEQTPIDIADKFYGTHFGDVSEWVRGRYPRSDAFSGVSDWARQPRESAARCGKAPPFG
ncbi:MAG: hypothetical protein ACJ8AT_21895, partial [Hyalangium sp.]|uniref:hypothetical protein n=1 Tax=Hyalangium sp. TaxID=2028555 RepID=UPI003899D3AF